jgi:hypothetical protein
MHSSDKENNIKGIVKEVIEKILPNDEFDFEEIKEEIWQDLSALYYKYEDDEQKKAFRLVIYDICEKIDQGRWDSVYNKLYRVEQKEKKF